MIRAMRRINSDRYFPAIVGRNDLRIIDFDFSLFGAGLTECPRERDGPSEVAPRPEGIDKRDKGLSSFRLDQLRVKETGNVVH